MDQIIRKSQVLIQNQPLSFIRSLESKIDWKDRLIGILGSRGTGKTTLLLQRIKQKFGLSSEAVYLSLDDIYFTNNKLSDFAEQFYQQGGKILFIDEVHSYPDWAREIKNLYDFYRDLYIIFTGSSITDIIRQNADLSRRSIQYELTGLSYREYLEFSNIITIPSVSLSTILKDHSSIATKLSAEFKPLKHFTDYLKTGYYPFFIENVNTYPIRIEQMVKLTIENDLRFIQEFDQANTRKIYQLLYILATNVPFKPNITKLSEKIGIARNTLTNYIYYLEKARLVNTLSAAGKSISTLQKPDKLFLENPNLNFALAPQNTDRGTLRESFFMNQLRNAGHRISLPADADFEIDDYYEFEIGGKGKTIPSSKKENISFIGADDIEIGVRNKIPLWMFGMLY